MALTYGYKHLYLENSLIGCSHSELIVLYSSLVKVQRIEIAECSAINGQFHPTSSHAFYGSSNFMKEVVGRWLKGQR